MEIRDQGCGMPNDRLDKLFINFSKLEENKEMNP